MPSRTLFALCWPNDNNARHYYRKCNLRAVIVAAVSTGAQAAQEKYSIPQQLEVCRQVCDSRGWIVVATLSIEGHSRNYDWLHEIIRDCPEYGQLVKLIESRGIDLVICRDYDRLWRTDALRAQLTALCRQHSVQIFSLNQPIEVRDREHLTVGSDSRLIVEAMSGVISQIENESRKRRHRLGMVARTRTGLHPCAPPYGYSKDGDGLVVVPDEARWVRRAFERRAEGYGLKLIAKELNERGVPSPAGKRWCTSTVRRMLHRPVYLGYITWGEELVKARHEAIVDGDLWERVQGVNERRAGWRFDRRELRHALSGLAICGFCGSRMVFGVQHVPYFRCGKYLRGDGCHSNWHNADRVGQYVLTTVQRFLDDPAAYAEARNAETEEDVLTERDDIKHDLAKQEAAKDRWLTLFETGGIPVADMIERYQSVETHIQRLQERKAELELRGRRVGASMDMATELRHVVDSLPQFTVSELRTVYAELIQSVELRKGQQPRIRWL